jgi:uncharacterized protein YutE (UPF0331/DUF86 family)
MIDKVFIENRLEKAKQYMGELEEVFKLPLDKIRGDSLKCRAVERILQLIVDEMIDINNHIIRHSNIKTPDDFQSAFVSLGENNILPSDLSAKLAPVVGLKNKLIHRYEEIKIDLLLTTIQKEKEDFKEYIKAIQQHIEKE